MSKSSPMDAVLDPLRPAHLVKAVLKTVKLHRSHPHFFPVAAESPLWERISTLRKANKKQVARRWAKAVGLSHLLFPFTREAVAGLHQEYRKKTDAEIDGLVAAVNGGWFEATPAETHLSPEPVLLAVLRVFIHNHEQAIFNGLPANAYEWVWRNSYRRDLVRRTKTEWPVAAGRFSGDFPYSADGVISLYDRVRKRTLATVTEWERELDATLRPPSAEADSHWT